MDLLQKIKNNKKLTKSEIEQVLKIYPIIHEETDNFINNTIFKTVVVKIDNLFYAIDSIKTSENKTFQTSNLRLY